MANIKQEIEKRRTFAIISHPDAGKTTLTEKLILTPDTIEDALEVTVIVFVNAPGRPDALYVTSIVPVSPGLTGVLVQLGVVHPHDARTFCKIKSASPLIRFS